MKKFELLRECFGILPSGLNIAERFGPNVAHHGPQDVRLAGKGIVNGLTGDTGLGCDIANRRLAVAITRKDMFRGGQNISVLGVHVSRLTQSHKDVN